MKNGAIHMEQDDLAYLARRAEQEIELAKQARTPEVVAAHLRLADLYRERIASARGKAGGAFAAVAQQL